MEKSKRVRKIITLHDPAEIVFLQQCMERAGGQIIKKLPLGDGYLCEFPSEDKIALAIRGELQVEDDLEFKLCASERTSFFNPFFPFPIEPYPSFFKKERVGWGLQRIGAPQVWSKLKQRRVRVGLIDTGIDYNYPDLQDNIKGGISTLEGQPQYLDDYGHGTHIAGIIGATGRRGLMGINPHVDFYVVKAFNKKGKGNLSDIIEGLDWLLRRQVEVINMSFSTAETNNIFYRVIQYLHERGIVLVAAAGNDGQSNAIKYPARFPQVIAVSATDKYDQLASFSSTGPEVDFCAPGVEIPSVWLGGRYEVKSGTSFAAPHLTGAVADLLNYYGYIPPQRVKEILHSGSVLIPKLSQEQQGAGMVELPKLIN